MSWCISSCLLLKSLFSPSKVSHVWWVSPSIHHPAVPSFMGPGVKKDAARSCRNWEPCIWPKVRVGRISTALATTWRKFRQASRPVRFDGLMWEILQENMVLLKCYPKTMGFEFQFVMVTIMFFTPGWMSLLEIGGCTAIWSKFMPWLVQ